MAKEKATKQNYIVGEVATQTEPIIVNEANEEEKYNIYTAIAKIMNDLSELKQLLN